MASRRASSGSLDGPRVPPAGHRSRGAAPGVEKPVPRARCSPRPPRPLRGCSGRGLSVEALTQARHTADTVVDGVSALSVVGDALQPVPES